MTKRLIIAPHADDESLGCGGLIAKYPEQCTVVVLSDKGDGRLEEFQRARKVLGYEEFIVAPFRTGELTDKGREVTSFLDTVVREIKPCHMYLPTPGAHQDHIGTYAAGLRASRLSYTDSSWFVPAVFLYDVPSYTTELFTIPYPWTRFEFLTEGQMALKVAAITEYASQAGSDAFSPAEMARGHAKFIGARIGDGYAEQYAVVREVVR